jgi:alpha-L-fucosidase
MASIPQPWQTDTCIGNWFYKKGQAYKSSATVIRMLVDIVSKNGNLLLNFPLRADGTLDADAEKVLADLAAWMPVNGEGILRHAPLEGIWRRAIGKRKRGEFQ